ncbi:hypothetical protein B0H10DRAFT_662685 [Mycena sp. CBHHK59/15]|nr:hypothetical protein B0H10DRAFT_662685 [Mycena sp. CBHHK59/15]
MFKQLPQFSLLPAALCSAPCRSRISALFITVNSAETPAASDCPDNDQQMISHDHPHSGNTATLRPRHRCHFSGCFLHRKAHVTQNTFMRPAHKI